MRLDAFVEAARRRVASGFYAVSGTPLSRNGGLRAALDRPDAVIAELKPTSPSAGRLLVGAADHILDQYVDGGAAALSILTDADHFDGHPDLLRTAHGRGLPVLMKDFILDEAQLDRAAHDGASAVLLIERLFPDPADREALVTAAHERGLEVLLEVHGGAEWDRARHSQADLLGVNSRDLDTLEVDTDTALALTRTIAAERDVLLLSGVRTRTDRERAVAHGAKAVLVGSHLMRAPDARLALQALRRPLAKVCGLTTAEDVALAAEAGADLAGFIVGAPDSPRNLTPITAQTLSDRAKAFGLRTVLVTPHEDDWEVREWARLVRPDLLQLAQLRPGAEWLHSLRHIPTVPLPVVAPDETVPEDAAAFVVDTPSEQGGGSGRTHAWMPRDDARLWLVAGGLTPDNAAEALRATGASGADASSGLESEPGRKDPVRVLAFVTAVHGALGATT